MPIVPVTPPGGPADTGVVVLDEESVPGTVVVVARVVVLAGRVDEDWLVRRGRVCWVDVVLDSATPPVEHEATTIMATTATTTGLKRCDILSSVYPGQD